MYFNNDKIRNFIADYFHWTDAEMLDIMHYYHNVLNRLILNTCIDYLDEHNLKEKGDFEILLQESKAKRSGPKTEANLVQFLAKLPGIYPDLEALLKQKIAELDESMLKDTMEQLDEPAAIKLLEIINEDLDDMQKFSDTYLVGKPQKPLQN